MKRVLTKIAAIAFIVGGFIAVLWPVANWRLYDADWKPLAMTNAESYCAGKLLGESGTNKQDIVYMEACIAETDRDNTTPSITGSVPAACEGLETASGFPRDLCANAVEGYGIWFLKDGGYTFSWNESHPRPEVAHINITNAPPRGERDGESGREFTGREGE